MGTVLVVEDDLVSQRLLNTLLGKRMHSFHITSTVEEAYEKLEKHTLIDVVILDNQLKGEYGWEFLQKVRRDFVFKHIPVVVYTGSSDRNSVIKYLQLGVQKILVKPYNAKTLEEQVVRAIEFDWRGMIFEPTDRVCERLSISEDDYYKSLNKGAQDIIDRIPQLNRLVALKHSREFDDHISTLYGLATNLGISILEDAMIAIQEAQNNDQIEESIYYINRLTPTARLIQHRALSYFGLMDEGTEFPEDIFSNQKQDAPKNSPKIIPRKFEGPHVGKKEINVVTGNPLFTFADDFDILCKRSLYEKGEVLRIVRNSDKKLMRQFRESIEFLKTIESSNLQDVMRRIEKVPGLPNKIRRFVKVGDKKFANVPPEFDEAISYLGVVNSGCIATVMEWLHYAREERNPLYFDYLAQHTLAVSLLATELSRKFKKSQAYAIAGVFHEFGKWILGFQFPAFYGIALCKGGDERNQLRNVERDMFGFDHVEIGSAMLKLWKFDDFLVDISRHFTTPSQIKDKPTVILASFINLAHILAHVHNIGHNGNRQGFNEEMFTHTEAWKCLRRQNIKIPLEPGDYLVAFDSVIQRIRRQIFSLFE